MMTVLFLVEKFRYRKMAEQLAALVNRMENISVTVQVLHDGETYRELFAKNICYKAESAVYHGITVFPAGYLYNRIVKETYDAAIAWTEGKCVRILSGCPHTGTKLYCMIHTDLSENGKFTAGFHSWCDALNAYRNLHGCFVSDQSLIKPFACLSGMESDNIRVIPPIREPSGHRMKTYWKKFGTPGTLQVCSAGENITPSETRRLYRIHTQLLAEGYWHRMVVIGGKRRMRFSRDTFLHLPYDKNTARFVSGCDIFLCINGEESVLEAMKDALRSGIPAVAVQGILTESILAGGTKGILTEATPESIKNGLRSMLTKPKLRYVCGKNARISDKGCETDISVTEIEEALTKNKNISTNRKSDKNIEKKNRMCYNPFNESGTVIP
ncbi:MAG: glycosyltransferase [Clostridia bacterium]|nr:glycosyltransferase [Clostridia bacterium]